MRESHPFCHSAPDLRLRRIDDIKIDHGLVEQQVRDLAKGTRARQTRPRPLQFAVEVATPR